jgi:hypothetical protein
MTTQTKKGFEGARAFALRERIDRTNKQLEALEAKLGELEDELLTLAVSVLPEPPEVPVAGPHACKNLSGKCIYDDDADPAHDDCLFCHEPEERK